MLLVVGRIGRAHGVHGEATVEVRTDFPDERFCEGAKLITDPANVGPLTIEAARGHNGVLLLKFKEVPDRNLAEKLKNTILYSEVDISSESSEDEFHLQQILGVEVFDSRGNKVGEVIDVVHIPGQDLLVVEHQGREVMIPFVREIVPTVDLKLRKIVLAEKEGLLDE